MKYRILTNEELSHLAEDFKQFLIVSGVHAEEWEEMNKTDILKAVQIVEIFSDTVLQKVYEKIKFVEFRSENSCIVFDCQEDKLELISIDRLSKLILLFTSTISYSTNSIFTPFNKS